MKSHTTNIKIKRALMYIDAQLAMYKHNESANMMNYVCVDKYGRCAFMRLDGSIFAHHALHPMQFSDIMADDVCSTLRNSMGEKFTKMHPKQFYERKRLQLMKVITNQS